MEQLLPNVSCPVMPSRAPLGADDFRPLICDLNIIIEFVVSHFTQRFEQRPQRPWLRLRGLLIAHGHIPKTVGRFNSLKCEHGLAGLREYCRDWDDRLKVFKDSPKHNWASQTWLLWTAPFLILLAGGIFILIARRLEPGIAASDRVTETDARLHALLEVRRSNDGDAALR
jgi:hypothetical protein